MNRYQIFKLNNLYFYFDDTKTLIPVGTSTGSESDYITVKNTTEAYNMMFN